MLNRNEIDKIWYQLKKVPGAKFQLNDSVEILAGEHKGKLGAVISLLELIPVPKYIVETENGFDIELSEVDLSEISDESPFNINNDFECLLPFVNEDYRNRLTELYSTKKGRAKFLNDLAHKFPMNLKKDFVTEINYSFSELFKVLQLKGAKNSCYIISELTEFDGKTIQLKDALKSVVGLDVGTFILCEHNKLAYYQSEEQYGQFILEIK